MMFSRMGLKISNSQFNPKYEAVVIVIALLTFVGLIFRPDVANNSVALWFKESILDIESTAIIGFVFKVIGFFFLMGLLLKTVNAFQYISRVLFERKDHKDSDFDDYEEVS
jgi:nucleoside permease NupC